MTSIKRKIVLLFVLCAGLLSSCEPAALKESLEVTDCVTTLQRRRIVPAW